MYLATCRAWAPVQEKRRMRFGAGGVEIDAESWQECDALWRCMEGERYSMDGVFTRVAVLESAMSSGEILYKFWAWRGMRRLVRRVLWSCRYDMHFESEPFLR